MPQHLSGAKRTKILATAGLSLALTLGSASLCHAQDNYTAPPMGWDPWNAFRTEVSEARIMAVADTLVKSGLADAGYRYVNVDDGWWLKRRADGRLIVRTSMFPSAVPSTAGGETSLRPFVDRLHGMGLKAGIYSDIGRNVCSQAWDPHSPNLPEGTVAEREVGSMDHQAQDMHLLFGEWNFDFIKVDACGLADYTPDHAQVRDGAYRAFGPYIVRGQPNPQDNARVEALYAGLNDAIKAVRPRGDYVLSICAWGEAGVAGWANRYGTMWRTSPDITPHWESMLHNFDSALANQTHAGAGHWNDPDMLEIGNGEFDADHLIEARAHLSLWAIINAPLLLGSDVTKWPQSLIDIASNREVIAIDQDPAGQIAVVVSQTRDTQVIAKKLANGDMAIALVNRSDHPAKISIPRSKLGLTVTPERAKLRNAWTRQTQTLPDIIDLSLLPHETVLYRIID